MEGDKSGTGSRAVMGEIVCCDAINYLSTIESNSIDCIITDPPYNQNISTRTAPVQDWDKDFDFRNYFPEFMRVLKGGGLMFVFGSFRTFTDYIRKGIPDADAVLIWGKGDPGLHSPYWFDHSYEIIMVWSKGAAKLSKDVKKDSLILTPRIRKNSVRVHPTQKAANVIGRLIQIATREGDVVLDPFMGSGTTAVACLQMERAFLGCDKDSEYVAIANKRLRDFASFKAQQVTR